MKRPIDIVSASEIASWAWCPESWRLKTLGHEPENQADLQRGEAHHAEKAAFEERSRSAVSLGRWLIVAGIVVLGLVLLYVVL